ncbi:MAG: hypothetical protein ACJ71Q_01715 [Terriglobales bacterium]
MWAGLTCLFALLPLIYIRQADIGDADIWWHMRAGEWMVQHHQILRTDPFSATTMGRPWRDYSWLFDVAANSVVARFDLASIMWFETLMRLAVTAMIFTLVRSLIPGFWKALGLTALAMYAMTQAFPPRPGAISVLLFLIELHLLISARREGSSRKLWALPFLFAFWANIHIEFVNGLFLLGVFCIEPALERILQSHRERKVAEVPNRQLWLILGVSLVGTLANPYGIGVYRTVLQYAHDTAVYDIITELRAMEFRSWNHWAVLALLMLGCFALGRMRRMQPAWAVLLGWSAWMGFRSMRGAWLVAVISVAVIALRRTEEESPERSQSTRTPASMRLAVATTVLVLLVAGAAYWHMSSQNLLRRVSQSYPLGAVAYIHGHNLQGPLLNEFSWGGFLIYSIPNIPVAMDGRTNVHTQEEVLRATSMWKGEPGWQNQPELRKANLVIASHWWPLTALLRKDPRFHVVYEDLVSVLFEAAHDDQTSASSQPASSKTQAR